MERAVPAIMLIAVSRLPALRSGIFADYSGRLDEISPDGNEVTVIVSTVGRDMPIKLDMKQIRKKKDD